MHSLTCSPTSRVGDRASSPELPDDNIPLLRAKLAIYFFSDAKDGTPAKILHGRCIDACLDGAKRPWPPVNYTSGNESPSKTKEQKRHVVLNSISWELDEMPALANAKRIANNPPLECGAGFVLWVNDMQHRLVQKAIRRSLSDDRNSVPEIFDQILHKSAVEVQKQFTQRQRLRAEIEKETGLKLAQRATLLYYELCHAVWKMGTERQTQKGKYRGRKVIPDSDEEEWLSD